MTTTITVARCRRAGPAVRRPVLALRRWLPVASAVAALTIAPAARADGDDPPVQASYVTDIIAPVDGGEKRRVYWMGRADLSVDSGDALLGVDHLRGYVDVMLLHGGGLSADAIGDAQVVSNVDAPWAVRPFEAWLEASPGRHLRAKAGFIDLNSEFDVQSVGDMFLNSSFGIAPDYSQSGVNGPSIFPVTSPGLLVAMERSRWTLRAAVFDAVPGWVDHPHRFLPGPIGTGGALLAVEGQARVGHGGTVQLGYWRYTDRFERIDGMGRGISAGAYLQYEQVLVDRGAAGALKGWARIGRAADRVNPIGIYAGGGVTWGTDRSRVGLAVAHARLGDPGRTRIAAAGSAHRAETAIELTFYREAATWIALQPDLQYVRHPGWGGTPDALVLGLRLHFQTPDGD